MDFLSPGLIALGYNNLPFQGILGLMFMKKEIFQPRRMKIEMYFHGNIIPRCYDKFSLPLDAKDLDEFLQITSIFELISLSQWP